MNRCLSTFLLLLFLFTSSAQKAKYSTKSKKAVKDFDAALDFYGGRYYREAAEALNKAINSDPKFVEAHIVLGSVYSDMGKKEDALTEFKKAIELQPDSFINNYYSVGKLDVKLARYSEGREYLEKFLSKVQSNPDMVSKAQFLLEDCKFGENALKNPVPFKPINLGDSVNSKYRDYQPSLTPDEQTLIFTVSLPKYQDMENSALEQEDFFITHKVNGRWQMRKNLGPPVNTPGNEGAQCISPDGKYLFYTACERSDGLGSCDIYMAEKKADGWGTPVNLGAPVNSAAWESQPTFASDGKTLYFLSSRRGGYGKVDIWKSERREDGSWTVPVNLGPKINTPENEASPFIHPDNTTLYFSSDGRIGMGGADIYYTHLNSNGEFEEPKNIGYPINTAGDESDMIVSANGKTAYFSSDRPEGHGKMDLYSFELYPAAQPTPVGYVKGKVIDSQTRLPLEATFQLIDLKTAKQVVQATSEKATGEFLVCIPSGKDYALNVSKPGYLFYSDNFTMNKGTDSVQSQRLDVFLHPIKIGESVVLKNIFFETNDFSLKDQSKAELGKLKSFLEQNPTVKIEIGGHTDNVGDKKYNQVLSEKRAKSVYDYLVNAGVDASRLTFKGYGDSKPIAGNDTPEGKAKNRRTEFVITSKD